jgi:hypothetical protein
MSVVAKQTKDCQLTIEQARKIVFLTSGCCEDTENLGAWDLSQMGLQHQLLADGECYPLTVEEEALIAEEFVALSDEPYLSALMGYSAVYENTKYLVPTIEVSFADPEGKNHDHLPAFDDAKAVNEYARTLAQRIAEKTGGFFVWSGEPGVMFRDGHGTFVTEIFIPYTYALVQASEYESWKQHLIDLAKPN